MAGKTVLVVLPVEERHKKLLESSYPEGKFIYCQKDYQEYLKDAQILIGNIPPEEIKLGKKLEFIQTNNAGVEQYTVPGVIPSNIKFCCASGCYGLAISEYMLACVLSLIKHLNMYRIYQQDHDWKDAGHVTSIYGSKTLVIGLGDIGSEFGQRMHLLGSSVTGIRRHTDSKPEWLEAIYPLEKLDDIIGDFDFVALSIPNTKATAHLMDLNRLKKMKKSAILINVGRGNAVVTADLCKALNEGIIAGAAVDVTDPEPLPADNPLWDARNIIITPHTSGQYHLPETFERIVRLAAENLKAYTTGQPLKSLVDFKTGYRSFVARKNWN
ncbi:MAG: D-2-hydroxyacid dehydrogenase [Spirochaetia bacterium]|nr:D-2-hydroxyacid dehydrogenase [Spirochaetia bacterium]